MVGYSQLITKKKRRPKLIITKNFLIELETVLGYSYRIFGERAANYFKEELMSRIIRVISIINQAINPKTIGKVK